MNNIYIRSQDREILYIFGNSFSSLRYHEAIDFQKGKGEQKHHTICIVDDRLERIANYESKERCLEVLDEIQRECEKYLYAEGFAGLTVGSTATPPMAAVIPRVYQMPER